MVRGLTCSRHELLTPSGPQRCLAFSILGKPRPASLLKRRDAPPSFSRRTCAGTAMQRAPTSPPAPLSLARRAASSASSAARVITLHHLISVDCFSSFPLNPMTRARVLVAKSKLSPHGLHDPGELSRAAAQQARVQSPELRIGARLHVLGPRWECLEQVAGTPEPHPELLNPKPRPTAGVFTLGGVAKPTTEPTHEVPTTIEHPAGPEARRTFEPAAPCRRRAFRFR